MSIINGTKVTACGGTVLVGAVLLVGFEAAAAELAERATWVAPESEGGTTTAEDGGALRVEVEPGLVDAELIPGWIEKRNPDLGQTLAVAGHEQWIEVEVGGATYDYRVTVTAVRDGVAVGEVKEPLTCVCSYEELMEMVDGEIAGAVTRLQAMPVEEEEDEEVPDELEAVVPVESVPEESNERTRLTGLGIAGIIVGSVGVGAIAAGATMVGVGTKDIDTHNQFERTYRPPGYGLLGGGAAALIAGTVMLTLDLTRCKRRADAKKCPTLQPERERMTAAGRLRLSALVSTHTTGLSLAGKF